MDRVDQPPVHRTPPFHTFCYRRKDVREITPDLPFVHDARKATGSGQDAQERRLRQAHR